jgi:uncharacterized membrane protein
MYMLDPDRGGRRQALLRDKAVRVANSTATAFETGVRDLGNRASGLVAETRSRLKAEPVPDEVLVERARSAIGRVVAHPHALKITAHQGRLSLSGPILAEEVDDLFGFLLAMPEVVSIDNQLEVHERAESVPGLQGGVHREPRAELWQENWTPGVRLVAGLLGGGMAGFGVIRRNLVGSALGLVGVGVLARAIANRPVAQIVGVRSGRRGIVIQKTFHLDAPLDRVFDFWGHPENFPRFMRHVKEVRAIGDGHHHWVLAGPAGAPLQWETEMTHVEPNRLIAWRSLPGSRVGTSGRVHFADEPGGGTRVHIQMRYTPPAGLLGHALVALLGSDPKHAMDADFSEMKSLLERTGQLEPTPPST